MKRRPRKTKKQRTKPDAKPVKLDLGCGKAKHPDFLGVDSRKFEGVDIVTDLRKRWPWRDNSVDEVRSSHFVEHLTADERIHFANELFRVLKPGAKAQIIVPYWANSRAYGDPTHKWPPVTEWFVPYLNKTWRESQAPHCDAYTCDFDSPAPAYTLRPDLNARSTEVQQAAVEHEINAAMDLILTLVKREA